MPQAIEGAPAQVARLRVTGATRRRGAKRRYEAHFVSKLTDADGGNAETDTWLDFARDCSYLSKAEHARLPADCREVGAMLGGMLGNPTPFLLKATRSVIRSSNF